MWAALMYYHSGELGGYHQLSGEIIERFGKTNSALRTSRLARACLLAEPPPANWPGLTEMVNRAVDLDPASSSAQVAKALAEYRKGHFADAIEWAKKCGDDNRQALGVLALTHAQTGELELAGTEMAKMTQMQAKSPFHMLIKRINDAHESAFFEVLLEEVKRKIASQ